MYGFLRGTLHSKRKPATTAQATHGSRTPKRKLTAFNRKEKLKNDY